jgi:hypothetical protein
MRHYHSGDFQAGASSWSFIQRSISTACIKRNLRCNYLDGAPLALVGGRKRRAILPTPFRDRPLQLEVKAEATTRDVVDTFTGLAETPSRYEALDDLTICAQIGGFCTDPFSTFPVESKPYLANAYGYYESRLMPSSQASTKTTC